MNLNLEHVLTTIGLAWMPSKIKCRMEERSYRRFTKFTLVVFCIICNALYLQSKHSILLCIIQNDGATGVLVFAHICTAPVLDVGGCTDIVSATGDCNATTNVPGSSSSK